MIHLKLQGTKKNEADDKDEVDDIDDIDDIEADDDSADDDCLGEILRRLVHIVQC